MKMIRCMQVVAFTAIMGIMGGQNPARAETNGSASPGATDGVKFVKHQIGTFRSEALGVADFNGDGKLDIVAGNNLYLAPDFKPLKIRARGAGTVAGVNGWCVETSEGKGKE